ncbi:MAG: DNA replication/repair protein RecF [Candidatus Thiodiazotropha sp.]
MRIQKLSIQNLRNVQTASLFPGKGINIIQGNNGAGKTTVLESIYLLARARAIKSTQHRNLIRHKEDCLTVFSEIVDEQTSIRLGIRKDKKTTLVKKDGQVITRLINLARILPIATITPNIQRILEEGPVHRRKLLNWGLFHVEHQFAETITRYNLILKQRNALLVKGSKDLSVWTQQLSDMGERVNQFHSTYLERLKHEMDLLLKPLDNLKGLSFELYKGWRSDMTLVDSLIQNQRSDQVRHFTSAGPHRADIKITFEGHEIRNQFSRGQKKIITSLMILAQARLLDISIQKKPILLIDDMRSELDNSSFELLFGLIKDYGYQTFLTTLDPLRSLMNHNAGDKMFHVEQGRVTEQQ